MDYAAIQAERQERERRALLDAAMRLLVDEGVKGLSLRRIAAAVGCSTTVLYTQFGGKPGLIDALWIEGFARLWQAEEASASAADPLAWLAVLGRAYRAYALANPDYYRVMFGSAVPDFRPSDQALGQGRRTFQVLVDAVQRCIDAGLFRPEHPELVASVLWATVHGVVSLELAGDLPADAAGDIFDRALRAIATGFLAPSIAADDVMPAASAAGETQA